MTDYRPLDVRLPICGRTSCSNGSKVTGKTAQGQHVSLQGLHPAFVKAVLDQQQLHWSKVSTQFAGTLDERDTPNKWDALAKDIEETEGKTGGGQRGAEKTES